MPVIPLTQLELSRARRDMQKAMSAGDWQSVGKLDSTLDQVMDSATGDDDRDIGSLLNEMGSLLNIYKQLMKECQDQQSLVSSDQSSSK